MDGDSEVRALRAFLSAEWERMLDTGLRQLQVLPHLSLVDFQGETRTDTR